MQRKGSVSSLVLIYGIFGALATIINITKGFTKHGSNTYIQRGIIIAFITILTSTVILYLDKKNKNSKGGK